MRREIAAAFMIAAALPCLTLQIACSKGGDQGGGSCALTCPGGYVSGGAGCMLATCGNCPDGKTCVGGVCLPPQGPYYGGSCSGDSDCPEGTKCTPLSGTQPEIAKFCRADVDCTADADCPGGGFCYKFSTSWPTGFCERSCSMEVQGSCGDPNLRCGYLGLSIAVGTPGLRSADVVGDAPMCLPKCNLSKTAFGKDPCDADKEGTCGGDGECSKSSDSWCIPGERVCSDNNVFECAAGGAELKCIEACGENQGCKGGACYDCTPKDHAGCSSGDVYWMDSCDRAGELKEKCTGGDTCNDGVCAAPCKLTCSSDSFTYTCATSSKTINTSYCSNGNISSRVYSYTNGHTVTCTLSCYGSGGTCHDDTGKSCTL